MRARARALHYFRINFRDTLTDCARTVLFLPLRGCQACSHVFVLQRRPDGAIGLAKWAQFCLFNDEVCVLCVIFRFLRLLRARARACALGVMIRFLARGQFQLMAFGVVRLEFYRSVTAWWLRWVWGILVWSLKWRWLMIVGEVVKNIYLYMKEVWNYFKYAFESILLWMEGKL